MRTPSRLSTLLLAAAAACPAVPSAAVVGDRGEDSSAARPDVHPARRVTVEQQAAIDEGLSWLARQQLADGSFGTVPPGSGSTRNGADFRTAVTALATLSFLGAGHGLRSGPYSGNVRRAVEWLLGSQIERPVRDKGNDGYISHSGDSQSKMHGHGYATLALAEAYATAAPSRETGLNTSARASEDRRLARRLREAVDRAVSLVERSQCPNGGWGYVPGEGNTNDHEGSVTVCMVQALNAAARRGFAVSLARVENARNYMRQSQERSGGFKYRLTDTSRDGGASLTYALGAAGVVSLFGLGEYKREDAIEKALEFLVARHPRAQRSRGTPYWFYGSFYAVQAFHLAGGERWDNYWPAMRRNILEERGLDGSWSGSDMEIDLGPVYPTAMMLLCLEVPIGYLSIHAK